MLGNKIKFLREKHKITQKRLAELLHIAPQSVWQWENNKNDPDILNIIELAKLFNVTTDYLLSITDENGVQSDYNFDYQARGTLLHHKEAESSKSFSQRVYADTLNAEFPSYTAH